MGIPETSLPKYLERLNRLNVSYIVYHFNNEKEILENIKIFLKENLELELNKKHRYLKIANVNNLTQKIFYLENE